MHGGDFDLCVVGGSLFGCAVAHVAAAVGVRTVLLSSGDLEEAAAGRLGVWLPALVGAGDAAVAAAARADREELLRAVPHLVRPVRVLTSAADRRVAGIVRNEGSTLPPATSAPADAIERTSPGLPALATGRPTLAFDALLDEAALARTFARAASRAGAVVVTRATVVGAGVQGIDAVIEASASRVCFRAAETLVAEGFAAAAAALHVDLGQRLAPHDELLVAAAGPSGDHGLAVAVADGWYVAPPSAAVGVWRPTRGGTIDDATVDAVLSAVGAGRAADHVVARCLRPTAVVEEQAVAGRMHAQHAEPTVAVSAARAFVRRVFPAQAIDGQGRLVLPGGPQEPLDPLWQRHGPEAATVRALARSDAALARVVCPHKGVVAAEVAHALDADGAVAFADVLRRLFLPTPCADPGCLGRALAAYRRHGRIDDVDAAADMQRLLDPLGARGSDRATSRR